MRMEQRLENNSSKISYADMVAHYNLTYGSQSQANFVLLTTAGAKSHIQGQLQSQPMNKILHNIMLDDYAPDMNA